MPSIKRRLLQLEQHYTPEPCILALDPSEGFAQRMTVDEYIAAGGIPELPIFSASKCNLRDAAKILKQIESVIE
ncbi:MAG: hypothetical protein IJ347_07105 [Faecalibacterium sp.]|nr:hypothetical protein [Faecalibacterium sp.]